MHQRRAAAHIALTISLLALAPTASADPWDASPLWDDGRAELSAYEVQWAKYGRLYDGRALMVLVKEPWAPDLDVKADRPRPDSFPVLKLNHQRNVTTGVYRYDQMASLYWPIGGHLRKLQTANLDSCGQSSARMIRSELETRSYFDGDADRTTPWPVKALAEDGLPKTLRRWVTGPAPDAVGVVPSLMRGRFGAYAARANTHRLGRSDPFEHTVPAGTFEAVSFTLGDGSANSTYVFELAAPHRLLEMRLDDGTTYRLAKSERVAYWTMSDPSFESWWPENLR